VSSPNLVASQPRIAVLNTLTNPFQWTSPVINTTEIDPPSLIFHTATLVENYMIVAFGNFCTLFIYIINVKLITYTYIYIYFFFLLVKS
jgi:hypothetical protein